MNRREEAIAEAADEIVGQEIGAGYYALTVNGDDARVMARAIVDAYEATMRPNVRTSEELEALPVGTIVRDDTGALWDAWDPADGDRWHVVGWFEGHPPSAIPLPARVLFWGANDD